MKIRKVTPILFVEEIEPCVGFWVDRLGFAKTAEVPHDDRLGFIILEKDGLEIMYQTRASVEADIAGLAIAPMAGSILFIEVDDVDAVERALEGIQHVIPRRKTFYGADEIVVREPAGNAIVFAQFGEPT